MSTVSWDDVLDVSSSVSNHGPRISYDDLFLRPTAPDEKGASTRYKVKILQRPHPFVVHWPNKVGKDRERVDVPFFDSAYQDRRSRNCHREFVRDESTGKMTFDKEAYCPWCEAGYNTQLKYVFNVYDRETKSIRICEVTGKVVDAIGRCLKNAKEDEGIIIKPESWDGPVPDFAITALNKSGKNKFGKGTIDYSADASRNTYEVDDEILEAIVAINPEAAEKCEELDDYKRYLHDYNWYICATEVATAETAAEKEAKKNSSKGMVVEEEDDVADLDRVAQKSSLKASLGKKTTKKVVEVEVEDDDKESDDLFSDDKEW